MNYSVRHYAQALSDALENKPASHTPAIASTFVAVLRKHRKLTKLPFILQAVERIEFKKQGLVKVEVESASPLSDDIKESIIQSVGGRVFLTERIRPDILAGVRITIDDEFFIDASALRQIQRMFSRD